ncbi:MAG: Ig-like domain-containing protein [Phycisphaerales bacterium]|nr:Ig-like domain-containing protein [Phycisphaerales bacterium]
MGFKMIRTDRKPRGMVFVKCGAILTLFGTGCTEAEFGRLTGLVPVEPVVKESWPLDFANPPVAFGESYTTFRDEPLKVKSQFGVLMNDWFVLWLNDFSGVTEEGGFVVLEADGSFAYTPPAGFMGADHFSYTIENDRGLASARVTIKIVPFDAVPVPTY